MIIPESLMKWVFISGRVLAKLAVKIILIVVKRLFTLSNIPFKSFLERVSGARCIPTSWSSLSLPAPEFLFGGLSLGSIIELRVIEALCTHDKSQKCPEMSTPSLQGSLQTVAAGGSRGQLDSGAGAGAGRSPDAHLYPRLPRGIGPRWGRLNAFLYSFCFAIPHLGVISQYLLWASS